MYKHHVAALFAHATIVFSPFWLDISGLRSEVVRWLGGPRQGTQDPVGAHTAREGVSNCSKMIFLYNVGKTTINHPPNHIFYIWYCFTHIISIRKIIEKWAYNMEI